MGNQTATALPAALLVALAIHTAALTSQLHRTPRENACVAGGLVRVHGQCLLHACMPPAPPGIPDTVPATQLDRLPCEEPCNAVLLV